MAGPSWLAGAFAAVMILVACYCAARLLVSWLWQQETELDADGVHAVMGAAMAGMLVPRLSLLPGSVAQGCVRERGGVVRMADSPDPPGQQPRPVAVRISRTASGPVRRNALHAPGTAGPPE